MQRTATVNYHISSPEQQAYHIDAGGESGKILSPVLVPTEIAVRDARDRDVPVTFEDDSVAFVHTPSEVGDFDDERAWQRAYDQELGHLLTEQIGATEVVVFDHTVRVDDPASGRKPARNVHSDYSPDGAKQRLIDILGEEKAAVWGEGHYAFINVWRPIGDPINSAPLGFVRPKSVVADDWVLIKLIYPDRTGQIMGLVANDAHEWVYQSKMTPDEVAFFNIYDSAGRPSIGHSALDMVEDESIKTIRKSIESRTLVRY